MLNKILHGDSKGPTYVTRDVLPPYKPLQKRKSIILPTTEGVVKEQYVPEVRTQPPTTDKDKIITELNELLEKATEDKLFYLQMLNEELDHNNEISELKKNLESEVKKVKVKLEEYKQKRTITPVMPVKRMPITPTPRIATKLLESTPRRDVFPASKSATLQPPILKRTATPIPVRGNTLTRTLTPTLKPKET
jgi:hypothetical protein